MLRYFIQNRLASRPLSRAFGSPLSRPLRPCVLARSFASKADFLQPSDHFLPRHVGPSPADVTKMLKSINESSIDSLISKTVPAVIKTKGELSGIGKPATEDQALADFKAMMSKNKIYRSHIGLGYYDTITPAVIVRNILENPGWYTPYTPYQAEISQGRLEMLLNFQTMVTDLTGLPISNCSLLDEGTAAAEAMKMTHDIVGTKRNTFIVLGDVHPQTIEVVRTRAEGFNLKIRVVPSLQDVKIDGDVFGVLVQYPNTTGRVEDLSGFVKQVHAGGARVVVASDLLALTLLTPPGEWGADIVVGSAQRFGVPFGFGGPHAAFLATTDAHKRKLPGRVIGISKDSRGKPALRMAMQTREQHIRRDKASSNICTAQALLANTAAAYAIYHGPEGLKRIAMRVRACAATFAAGASSIGLNVANQTFFDTVAVNAPGKAQALVDAALAKKINIRKIDDNNVAVSFDETSTGEHVDELLAALSKVTGKKSVKAKALIEKVDLAYPAGLARKSAFLTHPVFNSYHSETEMLRYLYKLQMKDLSLATAMIPLGSCTMKLNATSEMIPITMPEVNHIHPFVPLDQSKGYQEMFTTLEKDLSEITGFAAVSLQPNAGSQGEYAGLRVIQAYHAARGQGQRNVCLIPTSAHGTNPASAVMAGLKVVVVACDTHGNIDVEDLKAKVAQNKDNLSCLMVTYPSTHGVFEESIKDICKIIHDAGGQVYMDGANLNAQVGLCSPGEIGADVCHMNLHKTFCIPHGGGGPGMGPIGVAAHLAPFLPTHPLRAVGGAKAIGPISAAPYSSASILPISYMYIKMMGGSGLKKATEFAILNANYMAKRLKDHYKILYTGKNGTCAHEFIIDLRPLKAATGISEEDVAKRLLDFNFHAPTMSFPVPGTLMVEPTESESLAELDRFCDAMIKIREEIQAVQEGKLDKVNNPLKNAPHPADVVLSDKWDRPYSRELAAYPLPYLRENKFWPTVGRLDNVYGDRNLICTCAPIESYK